MLDSIIQRFGAGTTVAASTATSATGAFFSFAERTLPVVSWIAAFIACISGVIGILVGLRSLCRSFHQSRKGE